MASLIVNTKFNQTDAAGAPLAGGKVYTYAAGTLTPQATYTDQGGLSPNNNPVTLDSSGRASIWLDPTLVYRIIVKNSADVLAPAGDVDNIRASDYLGPALAGSGGAALVGWIRSATGAVLKTQANLNDAEAVNVIDFMTAAQITDAASRTNALDCTAAVQAAVTHCIANHKSLKVPYRVRITTVNIDRAESPTYDEYFRIFTDTGGGFYTTTAAPMFSTTLAFTTAPVVSLIKFERIYFEASTAALNAYVLDDAKFLRTTFDSCDFSKIRCLVALTVYTQAIYFYKCNMRRQSGTFFRSSGSATFDLKVHGCIGEAGNEWFKVSSAVGCSFVQNELEGSTTAAAISINASQGTLISGNYFESNAIDIDLSLGSHLGLALLGNVFLVTTSIGTQNVYWGTAENCVSIGNYSDSKLHSLAVASHVRIADYAVVSVTNRSGQSEIPWNEPGFDAYAASAQTPVVTSTFTKVTTGTTVIDTNANFAANRFSPTVPGYYKFDGKINFTATGGGTNTRVIVSVYKNGAEAHRLVDTVLSSTGTVILGGSCEILMNGSTDYVELWGYVTGSGTPTFGFGSPPEASRFSGQFVRSLGV